MITSEFKFYVSTNARKDLATKKWEKGSMLPLTEDIIKMNQYVTLQERQWSQKLSDEPTSMHYLRRLTETLLAHVILLNRKRTGEAERIKIEDYLRENDDLGAEDIYSSLTATEKVLIKDLKRFVIRGKRGRAVPVIFTAEMQQHTNILLKSRKFLAKENIYLFANPATENIKC